MDTKKGFIRDFLEQGAVISTPQKKIWLAWGTTTRHKSPPESVYPVLFCSDFFLEESHPWLTFEYYQELFISEFIHLLLPHASTKLTHGWHNPYKAFFRTSIDHIRKKILLEELQKAVPFIYEISTTPMTVNQMSTSLIKACQFMEKFPLNLYGMWNKNEGFLGLTPEILISITAHNRKWKLSSYALAGTNDAHADGFLSMTYSKNQLEHNIVRNEIVSALSHLGKIHVGELEEVALPSLRHFKTSICVEIESPPSIEELIRLLHPTPALGAYPRLNGTPWLKYYQTLLDRKRYGSPVGYTLGPDKEANIYVAIRNVQWTPSEMRIAAGCGIVAGSRFEDEWYEVNLKIKSIKQALDL